MFRMKAIGLSCLCLTTLYSNPALSDGVFSKSSDVAGISLVTKSDEAKSIFASRASSVLSEVRIVITVHGVQNNLMVGYNIDAKDGTADRNNDFMHIAIDPDTQSKTIFGIARNAVFPQSSRPLTQTVISSLIQKYGEPRYRYNHLAYYEMFWSTSSAAVGDQTAAGCVSQSKAYLPGLTYGGGVNANSWAHDFGNVINSFFNRSPNRMASCGTFLDINIHNVNSPGYEEFAEFMDERLFDSDSARGVMRRVSDKFSNTPTPQNDYKPPL